MYSVYNFKILQHGDHISVYMYKIHTYIETILVFTYIRYTHTAWKMARTPCVTAWKIAGTSCVTAWKIAGTSCVIALEPLCIKCVMSHINYILCTDLLKPNFGRFSSTNIRYLGMSAQYWHHTPQIPSPISNHIGVVPSGYSPGVATDPYPHRKVPRG